MTSARDLARQLTSRPSWPQGVERPPKHRNIGIDYDTTWTRTPAARWARRALLDGALIPAARYLATPTVIGRDVLDPIAGPVIFAPNHTSHFDTSVLLAALPAARRRKTVVAAAADYFFDRPWKAAASSLVLGAIPVERSRVNRQSAEIALALIADGWSLLIFPEGGRSPDGWGQEFSPASAAYLSKRSGAPVVPVHLDGVRQILPKGGSTVRRNHVTVRFGTPMHPLPAKEGRREEDARKFALRIEQAVAVLADEAQSNWWDARRRAADGATPAYRGPEVSSWRRAWALPQRRTSSRQRGRSVTPW